MSFDINEDIELDNISTKSINNNSNNNNNNNNNNYKHINKTEDDLSTDINTNDSFTMKEDYYANNNIPFIGRIEYAEEHTYSDYLENDYRINHNTCNRATGSIVTCHNETGSIWTHIVGISIVLILVIRVFSISQSEYYEINRIKGRYHYEDYDISDSNNINSNNTMIIKEDEYMSISIQLELCINNIKGVDMYINQYYNSNSVSNNDKDSKLIHETNKIIKVIDNTLFIIKNITDKSTQIRKYHPTVVRYSKIHKYNENISKLMKLNNKIVLYKIFNDKDNIITNNTTNSNNSTNLNINKIKSKLHTLKSLLDSEYYSIYNSLKNIFKVYNYRKKSNLQKEKSFYKQIYINKWPMQVQNFCYCITLFLSFLYHTYLVLSKPIKRILQKLDFSGIIFSLVGSTIPPYYYFYYCSNFYMILYISMIVIVGFSILVVISLPQYDGHPYIHVVLFAILSVICFSPLIHIYVFFDRSIGMIDDPQLSMYFLGNFVLGFGALFYMSKIPERFSFYKSTRYCLSHQIWHVLVVLSMMIIHEGSVRSYYDRLAHECPV